MHAILHLHHDSAVSVLYNPTLITRLRHDPNSILSPSRNDHRISYLAI